MNRLKICMVATGTPGVPPRGGGGLERVIYELTKALSKLGHNVTLIDTASIEERDLKADLSFCEVIRVRHLNLVRLHSLPCRYLLHEFVRQISLVFYALALIPLMIHLFSYKYDIIHVHNRYTFLATKLAQILSGVHTPIIFTCHNGSLLKNRYPLWLRIYWIPEWISLRSATRITAMSKALKEAITRFALLDGKADKIDVIPNGVDTSTFYPHASRRCKKNIHIICVSHIVRIKGQRCAIEAVRILRQQGLSNIKLFLVGAVIDFAYYQELLHIIEKYDLKQNVEFLGEISHHRIPKLLNDADIAIWPSGVEQNMPLSILEYLASGKPVFARSFPQLEEILPKGVVVYFDDVSELARKIMHLLGNKSLRKEFETRGRDFVETNYDWNRIAKTMEVMYCRTVREHLCNVCA